MCQAPSVGLPLVSEFVTTDGNWHRIGLLWDGSCRHLYVGGADVARDAAPLPNLKGASGGLYLGGDIVMRSIYLANR
ncbi:MAG: hypothetical protein ABIF19_18835 [Planctomycetota bacterium]